jgi:hypothetical protein
MSSSNGLGSIAVVRAMTILALVVWFVAAAVASFFGFPNESPFGLWSFVAIPSLGFVLAYSLSKSFRDFTAAISLALLVGAHLWRFVGVGFIYAWLTGRLAAGFAIPAGVGDIIVAAGSLMLLPSLLRGSASRRWLLLWNWVGLADLVAAIALGAAYSQNMVGAAQPSAATTSLMTTFPISLIPTFFVPLFILVHLLIFKRIATPSPRHRMSVA